LALWLEGKAKHDYYGSVETIIKVKQIELIVSALRLLAQQPAAQAPALALAEEIAALTAEYNTLPIVDNGLWYPLGNLIELLEKQASVARGVELWRGDVAKRRAALAAAEAGEAGA